jgi:hypothetical protein
VLLPGNRRVRDREARGLIWCHAMPRRQSPQGAALCLSIPERRPSRSFSVTSLSWIGPSLHLRLAARGKRPTIEQGSQLPALMPRLCLIFERLFVAYFGGGGKTSRGSQNAPRRAVLYSWEWVWWCQKHTGFSSQHFGSWEAHPVPGKARTVPGNISVVSENIRFSIKHARTSTHTRELYSY